MRIKFEDLVIQETTNYLIVNKPPFFPTLDDRHEALSILDLAKNTNKDLQICHRLDKETSGALVIAKNADAYRHMAIQFENREVQKVYHALINGVHDFEPIQVDVPLWASTNGIARVDHHRGKPSMTKVRVAKAYKQHTLIECKPVTGRLHQIRIHMTYLNSPLVGDEMYGGEHIYLSQLKKHFNLKKDTEELPLIKRVALHAYSISFSELDGTQVEVEAPYPKDFAVLIKQLEKHT